MAKTLRVLSSISGVSDSALSRILARVRNEPSLLDEAPTVADELETSPADDEEVLHNNLAILEFAIERARADVASHGLEQCDAVACIGAASLGAAPAAPLCAEAVADSVMVLASVDAGPTKPCGEADDFPDTLVVLSSDDDKPVVTNARSAAPPPNRSRSPPARAPLGNATTEAWMHLNRFPIVLAESASAPQIKWRLQSPRESDPTGHGLVVLNEFAGRYRKFKVGHTWCPRKRLERFRRDGHHVHRLVFVFVAEDSDISARCEEQLISALRGDPRLLNYPERVGGELAHIGVSPFFVYLAFQGLVRGA